MLRLKPGAGLTLITFLVSLYLLTYGGLLHSIDEVSVLSTAAQLARSGEIHINQVLWMGEAIDIGKIGLDGNLYSKHSMLLGILSAPSFFIAYRWPSIGNVEVALLETIAITALTAWLVFHSVRRLGYSERIATAGGLTFGLATLAWPYSRYFFSEALSALLLGAGLYGMIALATGGSGWWRAFTGLAFGLALMNKPSNLFFLAVPVGFLLLTSLARRPTAGSATDRSHGLGDAVREVFTLVTPLAVCLALIVLYNVWRFGDPLDFGYAPQEVFTSPVATGLWGLLFSPGKGIIWYVPACLIGLAGWLLLARRHPALTGPIALGLLAYLVMMARWFNWWGGLDWGPRFLVPLMPLVGIGVATWLADGPAHRWVRLVSGLWIALSITAQVPAVLTDYVPYELAWFQEMGEDWQSNPVLLNTVSRSPLFQQWAEVVAGHFDPWWARGGVGPHWPLALALAAGAAGLLLVVLARERLVISSRRLGLATCGLALVALGSFAVGRAGQDPATQAYRDTLTFPALQRVQSGIQPAEGIVSLQPLSYATHLNWYKAPNPFLGLSVEPDPPAAVRAALDRLAGSTAGLWVLIEPDRPLVWDRGRALLGHLLGLRSYRLQPEPSSLLHLTPASQAPPLATFGGQLALIEGRAGRVAADGGSRVEVRLVWRAVDRPAADYTAFVHAVDAAGRPIAQSDGPPLDGLLPTTDWPVGTEVVDERAFDLPAEAPCQLRVGLYLLSSGERLPVTQAGDPATRTVALPCAGEEMRE